MISKACASNSSRKDGPESIVHRSHFFTSAAMFACKYAMSATVVGLQFKHVMIRFLAGMHCVLLQSQLLN